MTASNAMQINTIVNGVDVDHILHLIGGIEQDNERSKFQFRLNNNWINGGHNRSSIKGYFADGREDNTRTKSFVVDDDISMIGSYNLDPRSRIWNSEIGLLITSEEFTHSVLESMNEEFEPQNSYRSLTPGRCV